MQTGVLHPATPTLGRVDPSHLLGVLGIHRIAHGQVDHRNHLHADGGLFLIGWLYDFCTLNAQISEINQRSRAN